jgi:hypothetical protein
MRLFALLFILILCLSCANRNIKYNQNKIINSDSEIVEYNRIGEYSLSLTKSELDQLDNAKIDMLDIYIVYTLPDIKIWYDNKKHRTDQICAYNNYTGKFRNLIGIKDSISDLAKIGKFNFWEDEEVYQFTSIKGISFNVPDQHLELEKNQQTIDYICIYR